MLSSWVGVDCCSWEGVRCDRATGNIVGLHLIGLSGNIPHDIRNLSNLEGTIPDSVGLLTKLDLLDVSNNSLEGVVFQAHFANLSRQMPIIRVSDLSHNKLSGPLANLPFGDPLNGLKDENFGSLYLQNNLFNGFIPVSLCTRTGLENLDLSRNRLIGNISNCLVKLQNLNKMMFSSNRLSGVIPNYLGYMSPFLSWLNLNDNKFFGELPRDLGKLGALRVLDLGNNKLSGKFPNWIGKKSTSLMILDIAHNNLTGEVPNCFGELYGMVEASQRDIRNGSSSSNEIVIQVLKGVDLEYSKTLGLVFNMDLSSNKLTGEIPQELTALTLLV
nr:hypothetical protein [Tanacetum cinerariifolium]